MAKRKTELIRLASSFIGVLWVFAIMSCDSRNTSPVTMGEYEGGRIIESELPREILFPAEDRLYTTKLSLVKQAVEEAFLEAEARNRGISRNEFIMRHVDGSTTVSEEEVRRVYSYLLEPAIRDSQANELSDAERYVRILDRLNVKVDSTRPLQDLVMDNLREQLIQRKRRQKIRKMIGHAGPRIFLDAPDPPVYQIPVDGSPVLGPRNAPVTIVVYSDFQCPYSARANPELSRLVKEFSDQVRLVFRHYPLPGHQNAEQAAEAAALAHDQGKFWQYHNLLFANQHKLETQDLYEYARQLELDMSKFEAGMVNRKHRASIVGDVESGKKLGVRGTPAIYINGKPRRTRTANYFVELMPYIQNELTTDTGNESRRSLAPKPGVLAEIGGVKITETDLPRNELYRLEEALYYLKLEQTKKLLENRLLSLEAESRRISVDSLFRAEIGMVTDMQEVDAQYRVFQGYVKNNPRLMALAEHEREADILRLLEVRVDPKLTFKEQVYSKLTGIVEGLRIDRLKPVLVAKLMRKYGATIQVKPPDKPTYQIDTIGHPSLGPENAPITIVMFSDFQCPYSQKVMPTIYEVLERYPGELRLVFRHFPLRIHARAHLAHEAAECAHEQGVFWQYHDHLFAYQDALAKDDLRKHANDTGMDTIRFNGCLDSRRFEEKVRRDVHEARTYHVNSTPSFFVNGTPRDLRTIDQFAWHITEGQEGDPSIKPQLAFAGSVCR